MYADERRDMVAAIKECLSTLNLTNECVERAYDIKNKSIDEIRKEAQLSILKQRVGDLTAWIPAGTAMARQTDDGDIEIKLMIPGSTRATWQTVQQISDDHSHISLGLLTAPKGKKGKHAGVLIRNCPAEVTVTKANTGTLTVGVTNAKGGGKEMSFDQACKTVNAKVQPLLRESDPPARGVADGLEEGDAAAGTKILTLRIVGNGLPAIEAMASLHYMLRSHGGEYADGLPAVRMLRIMQGIIGITSEELPDDWMALTLTALHALERADMAEAAARAAGQDQEGEGTGAGADAEMPDALPEATVVMAAAALPVCVALQALVAACAPCAKGAALTHETWREGVGDSPDESTLDHLTGHYVLNEAAKWVANARGRPETTVGSPIIDLHIQRSPEFQEALREAATPDPPTRAARAKRAVVGEMTHPVELETGPTVRALHPLRPPELNGVPAEEVAAAIEVCLAPNTKLLTTLNGWLGDDRPDCFVTEVCGTGMIESALGECIDRHGRTPTPLGPPSSARAPGTNGGAREVGQGDTQRGPRGTHLHCK